MAGAMTFATPEHPLLVVDIMDLGEQPRDPLRCNATELSALPRLRAQAKLQRLLQPPSRFRVAFAKEVVARALWDYRARMLLPPGR